jgi:hypothetical protein
MNAWSSMMAKLHDHLTPSGRRASKPERQARKARARQMRKQAATGPEHTYPVE